MGCPPPRFKRTFGSEPNKEILIDFLNQLFKERKVIRDLTYNPTEKYGDDEQSKKVVFDLLCICDNGEQIFVEMQRAGRPYIKKCVLQNALTKINTFDL